MMINDLESMLSPRPLGPHSESGRGVLAMAPPRSLLVAAAAARDQAIAPLRLGAALARTLQARPRVISAIPQGAAAPLPTASADQAHHALELRDLVAEVTGGVEEWPIDVAHGAAAPVILKELRELHPDLLVTGLRPHEAPPRAFGDETVIDILRRASAPVLCVTPELRDRPKVVLAAVDFSRGSLRALGLALTIAAPDARVILAHVERVPSGSGRDARAFGEIYRRGVEAAFRPLHEAIVARGFPAVERVLRRGDPTTELRALARDVGAELVTVGMHRYALASRQMPGSVTAALVREGRHSLLIAPPA